MALILKKATAEQLYEADVHTFPSWGAPQLTLAQYISREAALRATAFALETLTGYVLVPAADPDTRDILAYVEIFRRPVVYRVNDTTLRFDGYGVGSVYTPEKHRKRGYATKMLAEVLALFEAARPPYIVSNLYSEIGSSYYGDKGWYVHPSTQATIPISALETDLPCPVLYAVDSHAALDHAVAATNAAMEATLQPGSAGFLLSASCIEWFQARSQFYGRTLRSLTSLPTVLGAYKVGGRGRISDVALWTHNFRDDQLVILHWRVSPENTRAFLTRAAAEARAWQLKEIVLWNAAMPAELQQFVAPQEESLPSLLVRRQPDGADEPNVHWVGNEKYAWI
ncbi:GNAT family acetyltransferase [Achlya hypogyna]|uniref:GNAT family acetyltransferase n=1 Tax=Achlya hypogyna TaxID=1202772 RepID=A0A1V9YPT6_ACHHY|nr:GNAT family acetyltransferase [Achlya hypogyna]